MKQLVRPQDIQALKPAGLIYNDYSVRGHKIGQHEYLNTLTSNELTLVICIDAGYLIHPLRLHNEPYITAPLLIMKTT